MSSEPSPAPAAVNPLTAIERRVLGVLVEKAKTTPDAYPMSVNGLVTGSNQKSNRDPVMNLTEVEIEEALVRAQQKGMVLKITGGRVERWRHNLYELWRVDKVSLAILAELLLRGPQTEGELRARASRMEPIDDLDALRAVLKPLAERRLVVYLSPEGRRGTMLTHGFLVPAELDRLRTTHAAGAPEDAATAAPAARTVADDRLPVLEARLVGAEKEIAALRSAVSEMQTQLTELIGQVRSLKEALGG